MNEMLVEAKRSSFLTATVCFPNQGTLEVHNELISNYHI